MGIPRVDLTGKVAAVTGSRRGIGAAIALAFAEAGADVVVSDIVADDGLLDGMVKQVKGSGRDGMAVRADVTVKSDVQNLVNAAVARFGKIDIWVNNAGVPNVIPILDYTEEQWDRIVDTHLKGCFLCSQVIAPRMIERKTGNIINISSVAGLSGSPASAAYASAKAGILSLTRTFSQALGPHGIRVNAIAPGFVNTDMVKDILGQPARLKDIEGRIPLGRVAQPADIANIALFLASDLAGYVTGQTIVANGGQSGILG
jgi:NAD(P)-dependent dehydrogenase (short-subunit alcohol dehydrogenase family)